MKITIQILGCILSIVFIAGCKNQVPDTPEIAKDTLVQYFQYKLNNTVRTLTEKESTRFAPNIRIDSISTDTNNIIYTLQTDFKTGEWNLG